jgi:hypothetical protein
MAARCRAGDHDHRSSAALPEPQVVIDACRLAREAHRAGFLKILL